MPPIPRPPQLSLSGQTYEVPYIPIDRTPRGYMTWTIPCPEIPVRGKGRARMTGVRVGGDQWGGDRRFFRDFGTFDRNTLRCAKMKKYTQKEQEKA